jgi:hypothetical protein
MKIDPAAFGMKNLLNKEEESIPDPVDCDFRGTADATEAIGWESGAGRAVKGLLFP